MNWSLHWLCYLQINYCAHRGYKNTGLLIYNTGVSVYSRPSLLSQLRMPRSWYIPAMLEPSFAGIGGLREEADVVTRWNHQLDPWVWNWVWAVSQSGSVVPLQKSLSILPTGRHSPLTPISGMGLETIVWCCSTIKLEPAWKRWGHIREFWYATGGCAHSVSAHSYSPIEAASVRYLD